MKPVHAARGPVAAGCRDLQTGVCCPLPGPGCSAGRGDCPVGRGPPTRAPPPQRNGSRLSSTGRPVRFTGTGTTVRGILL